jgi:fumarate reductase subunit C
VGEAVSRRPYRRALPRASWFLRQPRYLRYMAREVSCIFIGTYALLIVVGLERLSAGRAAYEAFLAALASPPSLVFHAAALPFALFHSTHWFKVTGQVMPVQRGESFLPGAVVAGAHYALWIVVSLALLYFAGAF